jgi:hypothetical protein
VHHFTPQTYSAVELLRDGRNIEVRALQSDDETQILTALSRTSQQSLYRRFFGFKRGFSESEKVSFLKVNLPITSPWSRPLNSAVASKSWAALAMSWYSPGSQK